MAENDPTWNDADKQAIRENLTLNLMMRNDLIKGLADPRRDIATECGWPEVNAVSADQYKQFYEQNAFAERCIEIYPHECWQVQPTVFETEDTDNVTEFEKAWKELPSNLNENSYYQDEKGSNIWRFLKRIDVLCGIGTYGILLLGLSDVGKDERSGETVSLQDPAPGFGETEEDKRVQNDNVTLKFLRVFDQSQAYITKFDNDQFSARYGYPLEYTITFNDTDTLPVGMGSMSQPKTDMQVHWSRVIHVADNLDASEVYGSPRLRSVVPQILDIIKLYGAQGEGYWRGAFPGPAVEADPGLGTSDDVEIDRAAIKEELKDYANRLQRTISLIGMSVKTLAPIVVDGSAQINSCSEAICIKLGCPKRVFMGSEVGELASSQDTGRWEGRLNERRNAFITPGIVAPFVDRLIQVGVLPEPSKGYSVSWKEQDTLSPQEKAQVAMTMVQAIVEYINGGGEVLMSPKDFLVNVLGLSVEEADATLTNTLEYLDMEERGDTRISDLMPDEETPKKEEPKKIEPKTNAKKYAGINFKPPTSAGSTAKKALEKRKEQSPSNRGGTSVGVARAGQLSRRSTLSPETVKRMYSFFSRHEVDKKATGFNSGEEGYPSKGRQAWDLWGGDSGFSWAKKVVKQMKAADMKQNTQGRTDLEGGHSSDGEYHMHDDNARGTPAGFPDTSGEDELELVDLPKNPYDTPGIDNLELSNVDNKLTEIFYTNFPADLGSIGGINQTRSHTSGEEKESSQQINVGLLKETGMWDDLKETWRLQRGSREGTDKEFFEEVMSGEMGSEEVNHALYLDTFARKGWGVEEFDDFAKEYEGLAEERQTLIAGLLENDEIKILNDNVGRRGYTQFISSQVGDDDEVFLLTNPVGLQGTPLGTLRKLKAANDSGDQLAVERLLFNSEGEDSSHISQTRHERNKILLNAVLSGEITEAEKEVLNTLSPGNIHTLKESIKDFTVGRNDEAVLLIKDTGLLIPKMDDYATLSPFPELSSEGVLTREEYVKQTKLKRMLERTEALHPLQKRNLQRLIGDTQRYSGAARLDPAVVKMAAGGLSNADLERSVGLDSLEVTVYNEFLEDSEGLTAKQLTDTVVSGYYSFTQKM